MSTQTITPRPEFAAILRDQQAFAVEGDESLGNRLNGWFDRLLMQAGSELAPAMVLALCLCSAATTAGLVFVIQENLLTTALAAVIGGAAPLIIAVIVRARRQTEMLQQLPAMMDELARAARTGRSLEKCLELVAGDTPQPLGGELQRCVRRLQLGMSIPEALKDLPHRTGLASANVLVTALTVHRETGGDLVHVLERLARTIRDRIQLQGRLRAATAASRATAILMVAVPPAVLVFFTFRDPGYLTELMNSEWGRRVTLTAIVLQVIGSIWVFRVLKRSQHT
jgi:tight adherence protein B